MYQVIDTQTNTVVDTYATAKDANSIADCLDAAYGAVRYVVRIA